MCEYCGCQALDAVAQLTKEHDRLVVIAGRARRHLEAREHIAVQADCAAMLDILGPHTRVEEEGLFAELQSAFPSHLAALSAEHRSIHEVLSGVASGVLPTADWPQRLPRTLHALRDHILKEQDGLFPAALAMLDPEQWDRVEAVRRQPASAHAPVPRRPLVEVEHG